MLHSCCQIITQSKKTTHMKLNCEFCKFWLPILAIITLGFYITWQFVPAAASTNLRIATGNEDSPYYQYALQYQHDLQKEGVSLEIQTTAGSIEALQMLEDGSVDLAFIQGGLTKKNNPPEGLQSVASLFYEPLWVFYRKDIGSTPRYLTDLKGKTIAVGSKGSGTRALTTRLLCDNGIKRSNSTWKNIGSDEAGQQLINGEVDAAFFVVSAQSEIIKTLSKQPELGLMSFSHQARAYTRNYPFLDSVLLGEGMLNLKNNIPQLPTTLLTTTAALVAGSHVHTDNIRLLTREALRIHSHPRLLEAAEQFPSNKHLPIPIHPDALQYLRTGPSFLERFLPFAWAARLDQLKILLIPLLTLLIPLSKGILPLYQWRIRSRIYRWYDKLNQIDRDMGNYNLAETTEAIQHIHHLHSELAKEVSLPLSYMAEFYALRTHTDHILARLQHRQQLLMAEQLPPAKSMTTQQPQQIMQANRPTNTTETVTTDSSTTASQMEDKQANTTPSEASTNTAQTAEHNTVEQSSEPVKKDTSSLASNAATPNNALQDTTVEDIDTKSADDTPVTDAKNQPQAEDTAAASATKSEPEPSPADTEHANNDTVAVDNTKEPDPATADRIIQPESTTNTEQSTVALPATQVQTEPQAPTLPAKAINPSPAWRQFFSQLFSRVKQWFGGFSVRKPQVHLPTWSLKRQEHSIDEELANAAQEQHQHELQELAQLKQLHSQQAHRIVHKHMLSSMSLGAIPVPFIDVATLTATQLSLVESLSQHYTGQFEKKKAKALISSMLLGALPASSLLLLGSTYKLIPGFGSLVGAASTSTLSGAITYATGRVFIKHYEQGGNLQNFDVQQQKQFFKQVLKEKLQQTETDPAQ